MYAASTSGNGLTKLDTDYMRWNPICRKIYYCRIIIPHNVCLSSPMLGQGGSKLLPLLPYGLLYSVTATIQYLMFNIMLWSDSCSWSNVHASDRNSRLIFGTLHIDGLGKYSSRKQRTHVLPWRDHGRDMEENMAETWFLVIQISFKGICNDLGSLANCGKAARYLQ